MISEPQEVFSPETTMTQVQKLYQGVKAQVETPDNIGKFITIDVLSGDYEINRDRVAAVLALHARHENVETGTLRIGYTTTYSLGGGMKRTK